MGAKRAVDGRSQPYDVLLAAYQKKSIGRPNGKEHVSKKKGFNTQSISCLLIKLNPPCTFLQLLLQQLRPL